MDNKLCVARDQDGSLGLYYGEPERVTEPDHWGYSNYWSGRNFIGKLPDEIMAEITWEGGFKVVTIQVVETEETNKEKEKVII